MSSEEPVKNGQATPVGVVTSNGATPRKYIPLKVRREAMRNAKGQPIGNEMQKPISN